MRAIFFLLALFFCIPTVYATDGALPGISLLGIEEMSLGYVAIVLLIALVGMFVFSNLCCKTAEKVSAAVGPAIGLAVLATSSSIPLITVAITSALAGNVELSFTNVLATNIANLSLVLGILAVIKPFETKHGLSKGFLAFLVLLFAGFLVLKGVSVYSGGFSFSIEDEEPAIVGQEAILLLLAFVVFVIAMNFIKDEGSSEGGGEKSNLGASSLMTLAYGMAVCYFANAAVLSLIHIAQMYGIPDALIGSTIVIVGTSFPELSVALSAMVSKQESLIYANLVTSSAVNFALGIGIAALLTFMSVTAEISSFLFPFMLLGHAITLLFVSKGKLTRIDGFILIGVYVTYFFLVSIGGIFFLDFFGM